MTWEPWNELLLATEKLLTSYLSLYIEKAVETNWKEETKKKASCHLCAPVSRVKPDGSCFIMQGHTSNLVNPLLPIWPFAFCIILGENFQGNNLVKQTTFKETIWSICGGPCRIPSECVLGCEWGVREEAGKEQSEDWSFFNCFWQTHTCIRVSQH